MLRHVSDTCVLIANKFKPDVLESTGAHPRGAMKGCIIAPLPLRDRKLKKNTGFVYAMLFNVFVNCPLAEISHRSRLWLLH